MTRLDAQKTFKDCTAKRAIFSVSRLRGDTQYFSREVCDTPTESGMHSFAGLPMLLYYLQVVCIEMCFNMHLLMFCTVFKCYCCTPMHFVIQQAVIQ